MKLNTEASSLGDALDIEKVSGEAYLNVDRKEWRDTQAHIFLPHKLEARVLKGMLYRKSQ